MDGRLRRARFGEFGNAGGLAGRGFTTGEHERQERVQQPLHASPYPPRAGPGRKAAEEVKPHREREQRRRHDRELHDAIEFGGDEAARRVLGFEQRREGDGHQCRADQPHLRIARPEQRERRAAHEEGQTDELEHRPEQSAAGDGQRHLHRHAAAVTLQIDAVGVVARHVVVQQRAKDRRSLVAAQRQEAIAGFDHSCRRTIRVDRRDEPALVRRACVPSGSFRHPVIADGHDTGPDGQ